jgi:hypothetical protein
MWISVHTSGATVATYIARISAVTSTTITTDASRYSGSIPANGTYDAKVGGAWKGPNAASGFPISFLNMDMHDSSDNPMRVNMKNDADYSITAAIVANVAANVRSARRQFEGYTTTPGDGGKAVVNGGTSGAAYNLLSVSSATYYYFKNLEFKNNGASGAAAGVRCVTTGAAIFENCIVNNVRSYGFDTTGNVLIACEAYACLNHGFYGGGSNNRYVNCISHDNTGGSVDGFNGAGTADMYIGCISDSNGRYGFAAKTDDFYLNCETYNNGSHGWFVATWGRTGLINCNCIDNVGYGLGVTNQSWPGYPFIAIGFGSGTAANGSGTYHSTNFKGQIISEVTYPSNQTPWNAPATGDFTIVLAEAINAGFDNYTQTASSYSGTVAYASIGSAQPEADTGGGGGGNIPRGGSSNLRSRI